MEQRYPLFFFVFVLFSTQLFAQSRTITGTLNDENGEPLPGVNVMVKGASRGTSTDLDGYYSISASVGDVLVFTYIGYAPREALVTPTGLQPLGRATKADERAMRQLARENHAMDSIPPLPSSLFGATEDEDVPPGVAIMTDELPRYTVKGGNLHASEIWRIRLSTQGRYVMRMLPSPEHFTGITYALHSRVDIANQLPALQNTYAQGRPLGGAPQYQGPETGEVFSWGPLLRTLEYDGQPTPYMPQGTLVPAGTGNGVIPQASNPYLPLRPALGLTHDLVFHVPIGHLGTLNLGGSYGNQTGLYPGARQDRWAVRAKLDEIQLGYFDLTANTEYHDDRGNWVTLGSNQAQLMASMLQTPASFDPAAGLGRGEASQAPEAYETTLGPRSPAPGLQNNPYGMLATLPNQERQQRYQASVKGGLDSYGYGDLEINSQLAVDWQRNYRLYGIAPGYAGFTEGLLSERDLARTAVQGYLEAKAFFWTPISLRLHPSVSYHFNYNGVNLNRSNALGFSETNPGSPFGGAADSTYQVSLSPNRISQSAKAKVFISGYSFFDFTLASNHYWSSTLPSGTYTNFLPLIQGRINFADLVYLRGINTLQFTSSWHQSLAEAPLLWNNWAYSSTQLSVPEFGQFYEADELVNAGNLLPEVDQVLEAAFDLTMFHYYEFGLSYLHKTQQNTIAPVASAEGFSLQNAADTRYSRWNVATRISPPYTNLHVQLSWETYQHEVTQVHGGQSFVPLAGFSEVAAGLAPGYPVGALFGSTYVRHDNGQMLIGADGFPIKNPELHYVGSPIPQWVGQLGVDWKIMDNLFFSLSFERKQGGQQWNGTAAYLDYLGRSQTSAEERTTAFYVFEGVTANGGVNTTPVSFADPSQPLAENRWVRYGPDGVTEAYVQDASWWRLNQLSLKYSTPELPASYPISQVHVQLSATNLWWKTDYEGVMPSQPLFGNLYGAGLDLFNAPATRTISITLKADL